MRCTTSAASIVGTCSEGSETYFFRPSPRPAQRGRGQVRTPPSRRMVPPPFPSPRAAGRGQGEGCVSSLVSPPLPPAGEGRGEGKIATAFPGMKFARERPSLLLRLTPFKRVGSGAYWRWEREGE